MHNIVHNYVFFNQKIEAKCGGLSGGEKYTCFNYIESSM